MMEGDAMDEASDQGERAIALPGGARLPLAWLSFSAVASSGPGGQNVNKTATKVQLRLALERLRGVLSEPAIERLRSEAGSRLTESGDLLITCEESRSQRANRASCVERLRELLVLAMHTPKRRRATRPTRASRRRRVESKQRRAGIKRDRRGPGEEPW